MPARRSNSLTLRGKVVVFTGYLSRVRAHAAHDVEQHGGIVHAWVTRETDVLVQGAPHSSYKYGTIGVKLDQVHRLRGEGFRIAVIQERELEILLDGHHLTDAHQRAAFVKSGDPFGVAYRPQPTAGKRLESHQGYWYDPSDLDRQTRAHMILQNRIASAAERYGLHPLSPSSKDCQFDVAWWEGRALTVVEVKTLATRNEPAQFRVGLGQILDYKDLLLRRGAASVRGVICVSRAPYDQRYVALCKRAGVMVTWPPSYRGLW